MDMLKILGNEKRREMLKILVHKSLHISALAREIGISVPVALKHINLLESANLINREHVGNSVTIKIRDDTIELLKRLEDLFEKPTVINAQKGMNLLEVLRNTEGFEMKKWPGTDQYYIYSIDGIKGYYTFQIDGKLPNKSIDKLKIKEDTVIEFQKLIPVIGRRIEIKID